jgi:hypothetical protein
MSNPDEIIPVDQPSKSDTATTETTISPAVVPTTPESAEVVPEMTLTVAGPCKNPNGHYVGLNQGQREKLQVQMGETVELFDDGGKSIGVFTVGSGSKELLLTPAKFTANGIDAGATVKVSARKKPPEDDIAFNVQFNVENVNPENDQRRSDIIQNRLKMDPDVYLTVPTSLATQIGIKPPQGKTIAPISKGQIKDAEGKIHEIAIVPTGSSIGFTTKAAKQLSIPAQLQTIRIRVDNGMLMIS